MVSSRLVVNLFPWKMDLFNKISVKIIVFLVYVIAIGEGYIVNWDEHGHADNDVFVSRK